MLMKRIIWSSGFPGKHRISFIPYFKSTLFAGMMVMLFAGIITGSFCGASADEALMKKMNVIFLTDYHVRSSNNAADVFIASFACSFIFLLTLLICGLSLWGFIPSAAVPFIKGYGYGLSVGYLYSIYGFPGIIYNILIILPGAFICCAVLCAACCESLTHSLRMLLSYRRSPVSDDPRIRIKQFLLSMLWLLFLSLLAAAADVLFSVLFSRFFDF